MLAGCTLALPKGAVVKVGRVVEGSVPTLAELRQVSSINAAAATRRPRTSLCISISTKEQGRQFPTSWSDTHAATEPLGVPPPSSFLMGVGFPNMQYEFLALTRKIVNGKLVPVAGFQFWMDLSRPLSRGRVSLRSASPVDAPSIVFNHLEHPQDVADLIAGVRLAREMARQPAWDPYRREELNPGADAQTDTELAAFLRAKVGTSYHASGTCRMGIGHDDVVDAGGRVHGLSGLRVIDASIMPRITTGNLNAPVIMLAEKLADDIRGRTALSPSAAAYVGQRMNES
jgi:GMC oxidoreductase